MSALLEVRGLVAGYGRVAVLRGIDLDVERGSVAALLGPNGAGKTTLLRTLAGLVRPTAGTVRLGGVDVTARRPHERVRGGLCLIPEGHGVFPSLSVRENLRLQVPPWVRDTSVDEAIAAFPALGTALGRRAGSLSGGQQQMLALARCFLSRPKLALLDEVSMGLAPRAIDEIFAGLRRLAEAGVALLLVEQYVARALELADTVHLIGRGGLTFSGSPTEVDEDAVVRGYLGHALEPGS
ncbi:MAG: transporter related [Solirubrobacterales bacterium]|nr:transporter related [Solirubrobacterales bacterium]